MPLFPDALAQRPDFWLLLILPVLTAALAWMVNRLLQLFLFGPLPLQGVWHQGLLGARGSNIAGVVGEELSRHLQMAELFRLMEPEKIAAYLGASVEGRLEEYVDGIMSERHAVLWDNLPLLLRQRIYARVRRQLPAVLDNMIDDMAENIEAVVDVRALVEAAMTRDSGVLAAMFDEALRPARSFLLRAGAWTGLAAGVLLALLWGVYPKPALLPPMMAAAMLLSCWLSRELLLRPYLPFGAHGWLYARSPALTASLAGYLSEQVLSLRSLMQVILTGSPAVRTRAMVRRHLRPLLDAGMVRTTIQLLLGAQGYADIKLAVLERTVSLTMGSLSDIGFSHERSEGVQGACISHLALIPPSDLERLVRPVLQLRLWWQLLLAAVLGLVAGLGLLWLMPS
ncbi:MAG: hypothetical protein ACRERR_01135 [Moraxellaceae bacterium]